MLLQFVVIMFKIVLVAPLFFMLLCLMRSNCSYHCCYCRCFDLGVIVVVVQSGAVFLSFVFVLLLHMLIFCWCLWCCYVVVAVVFDVAVLFLLSLRSLMLVYLLCLLLSSLLCAALLMLF